MPRYAAETSVSSEKSRGEIERTLRRYGCHEFAYSTSPKSAAIGFRMKSLSIRFTLPMPDPSSFDLTPTGKARSIDARMAVHDQATRQRWRALALAIKAKLEAVDCGITTFEEEFLAHVVAGGGRTIGEMMVGRLPEIAHGGPLLLTDERSTDA